jgi:acetyl/propionyl-CoA carboxylase alpha subunit
MIFIFIRKENVVFSVKKVVEEAFILTPELRKEMGEAACYVANLYHLGANCEFY